MAKRPPGQQQQSQHENMVVEDKTRGPAAGESEPDDGVTWKVLPRIGCLAYFLRLYHYTGID